MIVLAKLPSLTTLTVPPVFKVSPDCSAYNVPLLTSVAALAVAITLVAVFVVVRPFCVTARLNSVVTVPAAT